MGSVPPIRPIRSIGTVDRRTGEVLMSPRFMRWLEETRNSLTVIEDGDIISATTAVGTRYAAEASEGPAGTGYASEDSDRAATAYATDTSDPAGTSYT